MTKSSIRNAPSIKRFFQKLAKNFFNSPSCYSILTLKSPDDGLSPHTLRVGGLNSAEWLLGAFL
jgi:hypothetical protein